MIKQLNDLKKILKVFMLESYDFNIECNINDLYKLTSALNVSTIVGYVLNKKSIKDDYFEKTLFKSINRYERLLKTRKEIDLLFNSKVNYLYVKGTSIAKYYPEPYLRYSRDIDIVVKENLDSACKLLEKSGYKCITKTPQEYSYEKNDIVVDLHRTYMEEKDSLEEIFKDAKILNQELDINYKYLYLLIHCMKHMIYGQLEYRFFVDLFYLRQLIDKNVVNDLLEKCNMTLFDSRVNHYLDYLLNDKNDDIVNDIDDFILQYAFDYGNKNRVLINSQNKSGFKYIISRLFIPYDKMCYEYPILKKNKILLPIFYIVRLFKPLKKNRLKYTYKEINNTINKNPNDINKIQDFINKMGIY